MKIRLKIIMVIIMIIIMSQNIVKAEEPDEVAPGSTTATGLIDSVHTQFIDSSAGNSITNIVNRILGFLQIVSALLAVIMIAATGFRYIVETPDVKSEIKRNLIPILIGIIIVFSATSIAKFFIGMFAKSYTPSGWEVRENIASLKDVSYYGKII